MTCLVAFSDFHKLEIADMTENGKGEVEPKIPESDNLSQYKETNVASFSVVFQPPSLQWPLV